ncbi:MAG: hypothetical protein GX589_09520, partial [Deltaproteobacteria bacterium]|nr:hypothetical protein [Deltaproteobacteria bacterium]
KKEKEKLKGEVVDQGTEIALRYIGYSQKESAWYEKYELDPYTTNRPLREKISRIVTVQSVVNLGFKFVPGIGLGSLSWLSTASSVLDAAETVAVYADPQSQSNKNRAALLEMGVSKDIVEKFLANEVCSPTLKALYVESLKRLTGVSGRETLVALISRVQTADGGEFHLRGVRYLASRHRAGEVLVKIMPGVKIAAAQTKSGTWLTPLPADYVIWSSDFAAATHDLLKTASRLGGRSKVVARLAGKFSPRCRQELTALGVVLQERVPM